MEQGRFRKGDLVIVWDPESPLFQEISEVISFEESLNKYIVSLYDGFTGTVHAQDMTKLLCPEEFMRLEKEQLLQLVDVSLQCRDQDWFEELTRRIKAGIS